MPAESPTNDSNSAAPRPKNVRSVDRAITALEILARVGSAGVSEIADEMGVHKSTASRLLNLLEERGMVQQTADRGKYQVGFGILRLATAVSGRLSLVQEAHPALETLVAAHAETANLAVQRSNYAVNIDQAMGPSALASYDWIGSLTPLHSTASGKIFLAAVDAAERDRLLSAAGMERATEDTITSRKLLIKQLDEILVNGYATVYGELEVGLNAIAVPIRDHRGGVIGSISVSGPAFRFDPLEVQGLREDIIKAGEQISRNLGFTVI